MRIWQVKDDSIGLLHTLTNVCLSTPPSVSLVYVCFHFSLFVLSSLPSSVPTRTVSLVHGCLHIAPWGYFLLYLYTSLMSAPPTLSLVHGCFHSTPCCAFFSCLFLYIYPIVCPCNFWSMVASTELLVLSHFVSHFVGLCSSRHPQAVCCCDWLLTFIHTHIHTHSLPLSFIPSPEQADRLLRTTYIL